MEIRAATFDDIDQIETIYDIARTIMRESGNSSQWIGGYPQRSLIEEDIRRGELFVMVHNDMPHAVFMLSTQPDPTYFEIEGAWLNDGPYGVIHRIASDGSLPGVLGAALEFAFQHTDSIRIDTHADNVIMRHSLGKAGFSECGIIRCHDGSPRLAFQKDA